VYMNKSLDRHKKPSFSTALRKDYKIFLEPLLASACEHVALKIGCRTRSKYIRYAVIRALIMDGYPLKEVSNKFDAFYNCSIIKGYLKGITL
jgi:hypothetical protein